MATWPEGLGQSLGDVLVTGSPLLTSFSVSFVDSVNGNDTNDGRDPNNAFATLSHAVTAESGTAGIIVLMSGHTEVMTATVTPPAGCIIVGAGSSGGRPTVKLSMNASNTIMVTASNAGVQLRNIWFQTNAQASNVARVKFTASSGLVSGCYFECGNNDSGAGVEVTGNDFTLQDSTFISTGTTVASRPLSGLFVSSAVSDLAITNCVFSDGTRGFSAVACNCVNTVTRLRVENLSLLLGANATFGSSTGFVIPSSATGASTISYTGAG